MIREREIDREREREREMESGKEWERESTFLSESLNPITKKRNERICRL